MTHAIEARPYGPNSTPEEVEALRARVYVFEPSILYWDEIPTHTPFSLGVIQEQLALLAREQTGPFGILIDLDKVIPPNAEIRALLRHTVEQMLAAAQRVAIYTGPSPIVAVAAKFVVGVTMGFGRIKLFSSREKALEDLRHALGR